MAFIRATHKEKEQEFFAKHLLRDGELEITWAMSLDGRKHAPYLLKNIDRWTLLRWYSSEYPRLARFIAFGRFRAGQRASKTI